MPINVHRLSQRLFSLKVADVMSRNVIQLSADQTMEEAAGTLMEHRISGAPVVDEQGRCVGVLSGFDFIREQAPAEREESPGTGEHELVHEAGDAAYHVDAIDDSIRRRMNPAVQTVHAQDPVLHAARTMCAEHVHRLVVLDEHSRPVGVITSLDLVATLTGLVDEQGIQND